MNGQHLFICGLHRSGTTLLEQMLHAQYDLSVIRNDDVFENEGQFLQDVFPPARAYGGPGVFAFRPEMHVAPADPAQAPAMYRRIMECWTPWIEGDAPMLMEKSPPNLTKIPFLRSVFPNAKFIITSRDPRVAAAATQKWSKTTIPELMYHWNVAYSSALDAAGDDCVFTTYESICADPQAEMNRLGKALGLTPRADVVALPERFATVHNSNDTYLNDMPPMRFGQGAWTQMGYDLG